MNVAPMRSCTKEEFDAFVAAHPQASAHYTQICEPPLTYWVEDDVLVARMYHHWLPEDRFEYQIAVDADRA